MSINPHSHSIPCPDYPATHSYTLTPPFSLFLRDAIFICAGVGCPGPRSSERQGGILRQPASHFFRLHAVRQDYTGTAHHTDRRQGHREYITGTGTRVGKGASVCKFGVVVGIANGILCNFAELAFVRLEGNFCFAMFSNGDTTALHTMLLCAHVQAGAFMVQPLLGRTAYALLHFLELLVGPRCQQLDVDNPQVQDVQVAGRLSPKFQLNCLGLESRKETELTARCRQKAVVWIKCACGCSGLRDLRSGRQETCFILASAAVLMYCCCRAALQL